MNRPSEWRGQWLSLHDLAILLGKSYAMIYKMHREGLDCEGILFTRSGSRIWARVDESTYESLSRS
jgi:hypothetical protein